MDETELVKMAVFKIGETARRMDALAQAAQSQRKRELLQSLARLLAVQEQELRAMLEDGSPERVTEEREAVVSTPAVRNISHVLPLARRRSQGRLAMATRAVH